MLHKIFPNFKVLKLIQEKISNYFVRLPAHFRYVNRLHKFPQSDGNLPLWQNSWSRLFCQIIFFTLAKSIFPRHQLKPNINLLLDKSVCENF